MNSYTFFHWGPFLYKTKLNEKEIIKIKKLCKKDNKKDHRAKLAGLIKHEYEIDKEKLFSIINLYLESYYKAFRVHWSSIKEGKLSIKNSWVNYMTKFESNPLHNHSGDLSFVIFLNIPKELKKEFKNTIANNAKPGTINFVNSLSEDSLNINSHSFFPEVGDVFIFPAGLKHYVNSFKSEGERVSISGNIDII